MENPQLISQVNQLIDSAPALTELLMNSSDSAVEQLEEYAEKVSEILPQLDVLPAELIIRFEEAHANILAAAENSKSEVSRQLKSLINKSRGFKAYIDLLPKKISLSRVKKG